MRLYVATVASPLGDLVVAASGTSVCALDFVEEWPAAEERLRRRWSAAVVVQGPDPAGATGLLEAYFGGDLQALGDLAIDPGGTPFQRRIWDELRRIPPGRTITYGGLAGRAGCPSARAVGTANRVNPIAIVVPCHRVVGSDGTLRGYAGGLERKRWLLAHEARHSAPDARGRDDRTGA